MKKNILFTTVALLSLFQFQSCKKDNLTGPEIQTLSVTALAPNAATFTGNIVSKGDFNPSDYGFIYSTAADVNETRGTKISLGKDVPTGEFTKEVRNLILSNPYYQSTIFVRAYVTDEKGTALGKTVQVTLPTQQTGNVIPNSGKTGDQVKISGRFYAESASDVEVTFSNIKGTVLSVSDTEIVVEIPQGIQARHGYQLNVEVSIGGQKVSVSNGFIILANVKDFSPKSGPIGTMITFSGDNLPEPYNYPSTFNISFGDIQVSPLYGNTLQAPIPSTVKIKSEVSITLVDKKIILPGDFTVTPPIITGLSPAASLPGTSIAISGTNFPINFEYNTSMPTAKIGSKDAQIYPDYQGGFNIIVPEDLSAGDYTISFTSGPNTVTAAKKLKVLSYTFTDFSPASGAPGKEVDITGNFIKDQSYTVYFGSVPTSGTATSATNLRVQAPGGINAGNVKIYLEAAGKKYTIGKEFKMLGPAISSFAPTSGVAGSIVTIKGEGFAQYYYSVVVKFGTIEAPITSMTENTITVAVPSNLNPGTMKLTVISNGQTVISTSNFTATN